MHEMYALVCTCKTICQNKFPKQGEKTKPKKKNVEAENDKDISKPCKKRYKTYRRWIN